MPEPVFHERLRDTGLSLWELGDLLGIHPHHLHTLHLGDLAEQPTRVLIELARRLDLHPADLVPGLHAVLSLRRTSAQHPAADITHDSGDAGREHDALAVLSALAVARDQPLSSAELADTLGWSQPRTQDAITHIRDHPGLGGPMALRRIPPDRFTLTARLDLLPRAHRHIIQASARARTGLSPQEATVLLTVLACGHTPRYASHRTRPGWSEAETRLKTDGLIHSDLDPHRAELSDDVLYSLRYHRDHWPPADAKTPPSASSGDEP